MYKHLAYLLLVTIVFSGCKTTKKTQSKRAMVNAEKVKMTEADLKEKEYITGLQNTLNSHKIDFASFSAKLVLSISSPRLSQAATGNLRIEKDKKIWVSVSGPFGIEGFRAMATPDSIILLDKLQNKVVRRNIGYLQQMINLPIDFYGLQDLLMGNALLSTGNVVSYKSTDELVQLLMRTNAYSNTALIKNLPNEKIEISSFKIEEASGRISDLFYQNYTRIDNRYMPLRRNILISEGSEKTDIRILYKDIQFDQQLNFPLNVPKNYSEG